MNLSPEQREHLETQCRLRPKGSDTGRAILAALADLDACRKALGPVAQELRELQRCGYQVIEERSRFCRVFLTKSQADAVLAAAGKEPTL